MVFMAKLVINFVIKMYY